MADSSSDFSTILGADAVFKGQLDFEKGARLLGKFEGEINSGGQLVVEDGATLTGDVKATNVRINGLVKGNLNAGHKVELSASARVEGDLQTARLEVAEGAVLVGRCMVGVDGQGRPARDLKPASTASQAGPGKAKDSAPTPTPAPAPAPAGVKR